MKIRFETVLVIICCVLFFAGLVKAQKIEDTIKQISASIEKHPSDYSNYAERGDFYTQLWREDKKTDKIINIARATADYSKFLKLIPDDLETYRKRAAAHYELFQGVNPFTIADLQKVVALEPKDTEAKAELAKYQAEYKKMYATKECVNSRSKNGFQGDASEPMTALSEMLDSDLDEENFDLKEGLKAIACGADVNYFHKKDERRPQFDDVIWLKPVHVIALLEAGAKTENKDKFGNTVLMMTLQRYIQEKGNIADKEDLIDKLKILLFYGADASAKNLKGQNVMSFAKKTGNREIIDLIDKGIERTFDGTWGFDDGRRLGLSVTIKEVNGKLKGDYSNYSSKQSEGEILSSKVTGNTAIIEVSCDWGGKGTVQITKLKGNKLHWKVINRDESKGDFIVLVDRVLTKN
ncbi:MAG TPA: hypothetical protein PKY82_05075 [Pyrinomonadaceae bacterium]|nr:hypothetical protein [Pyrinomonadaceae bacterium]